MGISLEQYRVSIGLYHKCISSSKELFKVYFNLVFLLQAKEISIPLNILFNRSFMEGKFSDIWKISNVIPLPKKGDSSDPSNFRPVSLLSNISKIQET